MQDKLAGKSKLAKDVLDVAVLHSHIPNSLADADTFAQVLGYCNLVL
jgi:hypothetical protein